MLWLDQSKRVPAIARLVTIIAVAWLWCITPASAGGSGAASAPNQSVLNTFCSAVGITQCPQLPVLNQLVIETAAISGNTPDNLRLTAYSEATDVAVDAGTLSGLTNPLAFTAAPGQPTPTSPSNPAANSFLSATTAPSNGSPTTLNLTFDFNPRTNSMFTAGQEVGEIMLPLVVADGMQNPVRDVTATLNIVGTGVGSGVTTDIVGDFLGTGTLQTDPLANLGITSSLNFNNGSLEFDLGVPLLITSDVAPAYFFAAPGFEFDTADSLFDGINPIANFLNATFLDNAGNLLTAAIADLAIAKDGSAIISDPVPVATPEPATLVLLGSGLVGLAVIRRRRIKMG